MDKLQEYIRSTAEDINQTTATTVEEAGVAIAHLIKSLIKPKEKSATVTRKESNESNESETPGLKITKKLSDNPDVDLQAQTTDAISSLNATLADRSEVKNLKVKVDDTEYTINKYQGGGINIESPDGELFAKPNRKTLFKGDERKISKDLPQLVQGVEEIFNLDSTKKQPDRSEVLYGFDRHNNFIDTKLSQKDAQAILEIMDGKEGEIIKGDNGKNLLIEHGGEKLFETDENGKITYNAFEREPKLNASGELQAQKGITTLAKYAKRIASKPDTSIQVERKIANPGLDSATSVAPNSQIGRALNQAQSPTPKLTTSEIASAINNQVLQKEFANSKPDRRVSTIIEGVEFNRNKVTQDGSYSISMKPNRDSKDIVRLGIVDKEGNFSPNPKLKDRQDLKAVIEQVLQARGIAPEAIAQNPPQKASVANTTKPSNSKNQAKPLIQANAPNPNGSIGNSQTARAGGSISIPTQGGEATQSNAVSIPTQGSETVKAGAANMPTQLSETSQSNAVSIPTQGSATSQPGAVSIPTQGGKPSKPKQVKSGQQLTL